MTEGVSKQSFTELLDLVQQLKDTLQQQAEQIYSLQSYVLCTCHARLGGSHQPWCPCEPKIQPAPSQSIEFSNDVPF